MVTMMLLVASRRKNLLFAMSARVIRGFSP